MPIPAYQTLMRPLLELAGDGQTHSATEAIERVVQVFGVNPEERMERLPSGRTYLLHNRTHWALTYLRHAGVLESAGRAKFRITPRGQELLKTAPQALDNKALSRFPEFVAFLNGGPSTAPEAPPAPPANDATLSPEETLEATYGQLRSEVEAELLDRLRSGSPEFFEKAVLEVLLAMGYGGTREGAGLHLGKPGDEGIDGVINEDKLGLDKIYIQAKRHISTVGRPEVQGFAGSLDGAHARKGVMLTTSTFSPEARLFVEKIEKRIVLVDGRELARHMVDHGIGVQERAVFRVFRVDDDYFEAVD